MSDTQRTSYSLLLALRDYRNDAAWQKFLHLYGPMILGWCRRSGLQDADADEVTGMVLLKLSQRMNHFEYDPQSRFRGWLRTVVDSQVRDFLTSLLRNPVLVGTEEGREMLDQVPDDSMSVALEAELETMFEPEVRQAMEAVRGRVEEHTWQAFSLTVCGGRKGVEAARELGLPVASVHQARSRVAKLIRQEVADRLGPTTSET